MTGPDGEPRGERGTTPEGAGKDATGAVEQERGYKRLFGLWLLCFLGITTDLTALMFATQMRGPWAFVTAGLAVVHLAGVAGVWLRANWVRLVFMVLLGAWALGSVVQYAIDPIGAGEKAVPFCIAGAIFLYLWARRRHFRVPRDEKPRLLSPAMGATVAGALLITVAVALVLYVDDGRREFPRLGLAPRPPAAADSFDAYTALLASMPVVGEDSVDAAEPWDSLPADEEPDEDWWPAARAAVDEWEPVYDELERILALPGFAAPPLKSMLDLSGPGTDWLPPSRELARAVAVASAVRARDGRTGEALRLGLYDVELGIRMGEGANCLITWLVGHAVAQVGLDAMQYAARVATTDAESLRAAAAALQLDDRIRQVSARSLAAEFHLTIGLLTQMKDPEEIPKIADLGDLRLDRGYASGLSDPVPFLKPNMTRNALGDYLTGAIGRLDAYSPWQPERQKGPFGIRYMSDEMGFVDFVRNPIGTVLISLLPPAFDSAVESHFLMLARVRLTRVMLAARAYEIENGRLPETLDALDPAFLDEVPVDPFTEEPFIYEPGGDPPRLLSVGPDQALDAEGEAEDGGDDIVMELAFTAKASAKHGERQRPQHDDTTGTTNDLAAGDDGA
jgi:hypothetical protein